MELEGESAGLGDFQDWELLPTSEPDLGMVNSADSTNEFISVGGQSKGIIRYNDYFSIDNSIRYRTATEKVTDWLDDKKNLNCGEFFSDCGSDVSSKTEFDGAGIVESSKSAVRFEEISEIQTREREPIEIHSQTESREVGKNANDTVFEATSEAQSDGRSLIDLRSRSSGNESVEGQFRGVEMKGELGDKLSDENGEIGVVNECCAGDGLNRKEIEVKLPKEGGKRKKTVEWWKLPLELLKYCVSGASPVWSLSMAAAFLGLIILGRRWLRMKQKSRSLQIKLTMDDKNVSQFMSRAERLNEAFTIIRQVPVVRPPSLPVSGIAPWPAMNMR